MPWDPVQWQALEQITSSKLNKMADNDRFLKSRKIAGALRNIDPSGNERVGLRYIKDNLVMVAGYKEFSPGSEFPDAQAEGTDKVTPIFEREFKFPKNYFDPEFRPVVVATVGTKRGIRKITHVLRRISASGFTISIRELSTNLNFTTDMEYFISYIALGVKL